MRSLCHLLNVLRLPLSRKARPTCLTYGLIHWQKLLLLYVPIPLLTSLSNIYQTCIQRLIDQMEKLTGSARANAVRDVFTRIAPRYDLMNRVMTGGFDRTWRRFVIQKAALPHTGRLLDIATATGDIAFSGLAPSTGIIALGAGFVPALRIHGR